MVKMAANEEKQQGHRPGVYKQKNKGHKHGKHRTKGEIERENKGKTRSMTRCSETADVSCVCVGLCRHVLALRGDISSVENVVRVSQVDLHVFFVRYWCTCLFSWHVTI